MSRFPGLPFMTDVVDPINDGLIVYDASADKIKGASCNGVIAKGLVYVVDAAEADQGVTATGTGLTIYDVAQLVGTSKYATIICTHSGASNTTTYTFDTSLDLSSYPYLYFYIEPGAVLAQNTGDETITFYSPDNIIASKNQILTTDDIFDFAIPGVFYPVWGGCVADGDGVGGGTNDATAFQIALDLVRDAGVILDLNGKTYRINSLLTLLRNTTDGPETYSIIGNGALLDFSGSGLTSGDFLSIGATSLNNGHDTGFIVLRDFAIKGPESGNPYSTGAPDGSTVGLSLEYCLNPRLDNVHISYCYKGIYLYNTFPGLFSRCTFNRNYIGAHICDVCTLATWNACAFTEAHYGVLLMPSTQYIVDQIFNNPRVEQCKVGITIDTSGTEDSYIKRITINDIYSESIDYDTIRIGRAFNFSTPSTRGSDRTAANDNYIWDTRIHGGHWDAGAGWSGSRAPVVFPSSELTVLGGAIDISAEPDSVTGVFRKFFQNYTPHDYVGTSADSLTIGIGEGGVVFDGTDGSIDYSWGNISGVVRDGTGDYTISFTTDYSAANKYIVSGSADNAIVCSDSRLVSSVGITVITTAGAAIDRSVVCVFIKGPEGAL